MKNIYFIGGSPCGGKSTICEVLSQKYNLYYFKVDDYLDNYMKKALKDNRTLCKKNLEMSAEEIWMREPSLQAQEELDIYKEIFNYIISDLEKISTDNDIITEGCAYLPILIKKLGISSNHFLSIIPTKEFQISHYRQRNYVPKVLDGCRDKEKAFSNWMERDYLFSKEIERQCAIEDYKIIINDGKILLDDLVLEVLNHFEIDVKEKSYGKNN